MKPAKTSKPMRGNEIGVVSSASVQRREQTAFARLLGNFRDPRHFRPLALFVGEKLGELGGTEIFDQRLRLFDSWRRFRIF